MSATSERSRCGVAEEAARYLEVVDVFAALGADPHAGARARAAHARAREDRTRAAGAAARKAVRRWRS
jgi:hypothetical protein